MAAADTVKSERQKELKVHEGHLFSFDAELLTRPELVYRCVRKNDCRVRIYTSLEGEFIRQLNEHTHGCDPARIEAAKLLDRIKERATQTMEVISAVIAGSSQAALGALPKKHSLQVYVNRSRNGVNAPPPNPRIREEIQVPDRYRYYTAANGNEELFLLMDSGRHDPDRIMLFGRGSNEDFIHLVTDIYLDGTFKIAPLLFSQVFVVCGRRGDCVLPLVFALLPNKSQYTYKRFLQLLRERWPMLQPARVHADFEVALKNAIEEVFPDSVLAGCLFHLAQNFIKHLRAAGLMHLYVTDAEFAQSAKMIMCLAFLPISDLEDAFTMLEETLPIELEPILRWFEEYYLGEFANGRRRRPLFPPSMWNVNERVLGSHDRTNNFVEALHRKCQRQLAVQHPGLWRFIDSIAALQRTLELDYEQWIKKIVQEANTRTHMEFLRGCASNFDLE